YFEIEDGGPHDLAEREGCQRQIDPARAQDRHRNGKSDHARRQPAKRNGDQRRHEAVVAQECGAIATYGSKAGDTQIELPGGQRQKRAISEYNIDREQHQDAFDIAAHAQAPPSAEPKSPKGRTMRMNSNSP